MNPLDSLKQAYELGRADGIRAMTELIGIGASFNVANATNRSELPYATVSLSGNGPRKRVRKADGKPGQAIPAPKAPVISRGVKKVRGPRAKGVKEEIVRLIRESAEGLRVGDIVAQTGFKETSVRATLMGLKKSGMAALGDEKHWVLTGQGWAGVSGNSDHDEAHADV